MVNLTAVFVGISGFIVLMVVVLPDRVDGECCWAFNGSVCGDCTRPRPYCGLSGCNNIGCGCRANKRGHICRFGSCFRPGRRRRDADEDEPVVATGDDVMRLGDLDENGFLSLDEAVALMQQLNITSGRSKSRLYSELGDLDADKDGMLSLTEIDTPAHRPY